MVLGSLVGGEFDAGKIPAILILDLYPPVTSRHLDYYQKHKHHICKQRSLWNLNLPLESWVGGRSNPYLLSNNLILILLAYSQANILLEPPSWKTMFTNIGNHFSQESSELRKEIKKNTKTSLNLIVNVFRWIICQNWPPWLREEKIGNNLKTSVFSKSTSPRKLPYFPWKSMVGKWFISYWNGLFWGGDMLSF